MSNLDARPEEQVCVAGVSGDGVELLTARQVPLGGTRSMTVRRTIPQRARSLVGAWCFCDHFGPDDVSQSAGMQVAPHPHTGLQTVTWLFEGEILHRDSVGSLVAVRPGELNLMTAGVGISHSEESPQAGRPPVLHGVQLWTALPASALGAAPHFEHHADLPVAQADGARVQVFLGALTVGGARLASPATAYTPLVGAQVDLAPGARLTLDADPDFEHAVLTDAGQVRLQGMAVPRDQLGYVGPGQRRLVIEAGPSPARAVLLGGVPFGEDIVMWWNFVGRSHDDVARARDEWMAQVADDPADAAGVATQYTAGAPSRRFGQVRGYDGGPLRAPTMPDVRLRPRTRARP
ncbi:pirin family protein [Xylanimonas ulmi]|uniref:Pirin n=1 Tax=Xylanimonas ulmi TaxID=228973 RepID=A0A4Q7M4U1_9MICO|nr:pirin family protein [Xylanibacterium ulmi]RZS62411.1 hypothetical protein EV386_2744 [Xylanibacterium ulmi]